MNLPVLTLMAEEAATELPVPAIWFGIIMFAFLMLSLLVTVAFSTKSKALPAEAHQEH